MPLGKPFSLVKLKRNLVEMFDLQELANFLRDLWDIIFHDIMTVGG